jgi:hypothetical protein
MNAANFFGKPAPHLLVILAAVASVAIPCARPALAISPGECVTAIVDAPFRLPDGHLYPAGTLTLCDYGTFSPVDNLHRISVDGSGIGLFRSRKRFAESTSMPDPQVVFNRGADGTLELIGYALSLASGRAVAYRLKETIAPWQATARRLGGSSPAPLAGIVLAAGTR